MEIGKHQRDLLSTGFEAERRQNKTEIKKLQRDLRLINHAQADTNHDGVISAGEATGTVPQGRFIPEDFTPNINGKVLKTGHLRSMIYLADQVDGNGDGKMSKLECNKYWGTSDSALCKALTKPKR